jgi:ketosteroid isomerase-like protein
MTSRRNLFLLAFVLLLGTPGALSGLILPQRQHDASTSSCRAADSASVMRVVGRFHEILSTGDTAGVSVLLAPDLRVLEGGGVESRQEYLSHHLSEDIAFAKAVNEKKTSISYTCDGNVAWLVSTSTATGTFNSRPIDSVGAELMILSRTKNGWKIRAIHWSSARRQPR